MALGFRRSQGNITESPLHARRISTEIRGSSINSKASVDNLRQAITEIGDEESGQLARTSFRMTSNPCGHIALTYTQADYEWRVLRAVQADYDVDSCPTTPENLTACLGILQPRLLLPARYILHVTTSAEMPRRDIRGHGLGIYRLIIRTATSTDSKAA